MMHESFESERLRTLIDDKKRYLSTLTNETAAKLLQREILFLDREILPSILTNTTIIHYETVKYFTRCFYEAIQRNCNGLLVYIPIKNDYKERPIIGRANCRQMDDNPDGAIEIYVNSVEVMNMDGSGVDNVECFIMDVPL